MVLASLIVCTIASWYGANDSGGQITATGAKFHAKELTAAHPSLPFGTKLRVTNIDNGQKVTVTVTDRGPFKDGRGLDLRPAAFRRLATLEVGLIHVCYYPENRDALYQAKRP